MDRQTADLVGFFRDGKRRIDIVLVYKDEGGAESEELRTEFIVNAIKFGLEIEVEEPKYNKHKSLTFLKIHTPSTLIEEYGIYFNVRKYFKESHDEFLHPRDEFIKKWVVRDIAFNFEKDWLKMLRNNYQYTKNYSNLERSVITYKILMIVPYRTDDLHIGIDWLLKKNVILDIFALHDGPYFKSQDYDKNNLPNTRQLLYNNWVKDWIILRQPVHLINEYLGERVAFYFDFFGMYNKALIISGIFGILTTVLGIIDYVFGNGVWKSPHVCYRQKQLEQLKSRLGKPDLVCPTCKDFFLCPFTNTSDYCTQAKVDDILDTQFSLFYALFVSIWAILFITIWQRREGFLKWLWEVNDTRSTFIRPEFMTEPNYERSVVTGIIKKSYSNAFLFARSLLSFAMVTFIVFGIISVAIALVVLKYRFQLHSISLSKQATYSTGARHFFFSITFAIINAGVSIILEVVCKKLSYLLTEFEDHRTDFVHEKSLVLKLTVLSLSVTYSFFIYFAFIRELLYTYPTDDTRWDWLGGVSYINCGAIGCFDDLYVILFSMIFVKQIVNRLVALVKNMVFGMDTDYNSNAMMNSNIPCWEREYRLQPVTEELLTEKYRLLVFQFSLVTWFVSVFPLASALTLPINIWDISNNAKLFLLHYRRPLFLKSSGPGAWGKILVAVAFLAGVSNPLVFVFNSQIIDKYIYKTFTEDILKENRSAFIFNFFEYTSGFVHLEDYTNSERNISMRRDFLKFHDYDNNYKWLYEGPPYGNYKKLTYCRFKGKKIKARPNSRIMVTKDIGWYDYYMKACFVVVFEHINLVIVFIFFKLIPNFPRDVMDTMVIEEKIKTKRAFERVNKIL